MPNIFCVEKAKKSSMKRLAFLPRFGVVVDFAGKQFVYRQAPLLETLLNMKKTGFSMENLMNISFKQMKEINLPTQKKIECKTPAKR